MDHFFRIYHFFRHFCSAGNAHQIHSPFVFELYNECIKNSRNFYCFSDIEDLRKKCQKNNTLIRVNDFGSGADKNPDRSISEIATSSLKSRSLAQILFRLVFQFKPETIVELGTSLGITTSYLASARKTAQVYSFEGSEKLALVAEKNFKYLKLNNISLITGNIDQTLPLFLSKTDQLDLVFFDANHRFEPTMHYFTQCLTKAHENTVFIFDDIYWSPEMLKAWDCIKSYREVTLSIDLYHLGLIFFRKNAPKQAFKLNL